MMPETQASTLLCQQCAAPLVVEPGSALSTCEYCGTVNYLDRSEAVLHYAVEPTLDAAGAVAALRRWMAGNDTVKGLDASARITSQNFVYFPLWLARTVRNNDEVIHLRPAAAASITELSQLSMLAAELVPYDDALDADAVRPTVPLTTLKKWLVEGEGVDAAAIRDVSLVHVPAYVFKYAHNGESYTAAVDAASGRVLAAIFPEKYEVPYRAIGGLGCLAYFLAALIPLAGYIIADTEGLGLGVLIYAGVAVVLAVPIFLAAMQVSRRY